MSVLSNRLCNVFIAGAPVYVAVKSYIDSKKCLNDFRIGRLSLYELRHIRDEQEAVVFGVMDNLPKNLCFAGVWPLAVPLLIIPKVVLKMDQVKP